MLRREAESTRDGIIYGYFGKDVAYNNGRYTYIRAAKDDANQPLYMYTAVPSILRQYLGADDAVDVEDYDKIEMGRYLSWTDYPVYRFRLKLLTSLIRHKTSKAEKIQYKNHVV